MSGYSDANAIREAVGHSATLLHKPFDLQALLGTLSTVEARIQSNSAS